jgi:hypothetical protein
MGQRVQQEYWNQNPQRRLQTGEDTGCHSMSDTDLRFYQTLLDRGSREPRADRPPKYVDFNLSRSESVEI